MICYYDFKLILYKLVLIVCVVRVRVVICCRSVYAVFLEISEDELDPKALV